MHNIIWIVESQKSEFFGKKGVFSSYIIPKSDLTIEPKLLAGAFLWIVLRGQDDRILKLLKIKKVERIIEGYYKGDFLVYINISESFKVTTNYSTGTKYKIYNVKHFPFGLSPINDEICKENFNVIKNNIQIKLGSIPDKIIQQVYLTLLPNNDLLFVKNIINCITANFTLDSIWVSDPKNRFGAFANFAFAIIEKAKGIHYANSVIEKIKSLDPISILEREFLSHKLIISPKSSMSMSPRVDIDFIEIALENICAREFLFIDTKFKNLEETLNKTGHAEKIHQDMLKDICMYLKNNNIIPYESASIDLMYILDGKLNFFEIKSATISNILSQVAKGAFQLACYHNELHKEYNNLNPRLIVQKTESDEINQYVLEALSYLGITLLYYDSSLPWPYKVRGLLM